jgi:threonine dehydratase
VDEAYRGPIPDLVTLDDVLAARERIGDRLRRTPSWRAESLSRLCQRTVVLKAEHLQRTGSFKPRGALNLLTSLPADVTEVVAASAGNHAQGVALAASLTGRHATVFMPVTASLPKVQATRDYGAEVILAGETVDDAIALAKERAETSGGFFASPFDHPLVIAGQGTVGLEIAEDWPDAETVLVPVGGGGLISGVATALHHRAPDVRVVGVQAEGAACLLPSLHAGAAKVLDRVSTIADGIAIKAPSPLTLAHAQAYVDDVVTVDDDEIGRALVLLLERAKAVVEPAGAVGLAALLAGKIDGDGPVVVILSGGNVDPLLLVKLIDHGLSASGRFLRISARVPDHPGALAELTKIIAAQDVNILDVEHHREGTHVSVDEVEVDMTLETHDDEHGEKVLAAMELRGITVERIP